MGRIVLVRKSSSAMERQPCSPSCRIDDGRRTEPVGSLGAKCFSPCTVGPFEAPLFFPPGAASSRS